MEFYFITFRSITPAQKAERLLRQAGYSCHIQRTPEWMAEQGCGYSLRVRHNDLNAVISLLLSAQVSYRKIYRNKPDGKFEAVEL